jgi:hypothetical protein
MYVYLFPYSMARNVLANLGFHCMLKDFLVMFQNELSVDDFVKHAKAMLGDPENKFKGLPPPKA